MMGNVDNNITSLFNEIYDLTNRQTLAFITAKCGNIEEINDILQETYMELYKCLLSKGEDYIENVEAFVINIAKQKIYRHFTLLQRVKANLSLSEVTGKEEKTVFDDTDWEIDVEDSVCTNETIEEIERILATKPQEIRKIFFLRFSLDLSLSEIASLMNLGESSVKNKLYRTIKEIRSIYATEKGEQL